VRKISEQFWKADREPWGDNYSLRGALAENLTLR
jgi:hypothetical protein